VVRLKDEVFPIIRMVRWKDIPANGCGYLFTLMKIEAIHPGGLLSILKLVTRRIKQLVLDVHMDHM